MSGLTDDDLAVITKGMLSYSRLSATGGALFSATLGLFIAYLLFSTGASRRSPLFAINCLSFLCVALYSLINLVNATLHIQNFLLDKDNIQLAGTSTVLDFLSTFSPLVSDSTLTFKLSAVYPAWMGSGSGRTRKWVLGIYIALLLLRIGPSIAMIWVGVHFYVVRAHRGLSYSEYLEGVNNYPAWIRESDVGLQLLSSVYASGLLLYRAYVFSQRHTDRRSQAWRHLRFFIESTLMSFVPPVLCQIMLITTIPIGTDTDTGATVVTWAIYFNIFSSLLFSVLATSWSTIRSHGSDLAAAALAPHPAAVGQDTSSSHLSPQHSPAKSKPSPINDTLLGSVLGDAGYLYQEQQEQQQQQQRQLSSAARQGQSESEDMEVVVTMPESEKEGDSAFVRRGRGRWR